LQPGDVVRILLVLQSKLSDLGEGIGEDEHTLKVIADEDLVLINVHIPSHQHDVCGRVCEREREKKGGGGVEWLKGSQNTHTHTHTHTHTNLPAEKRSEIKEEGLKRWGIRAAHQNTVLANYNHLDAPQTHCKDVGCRERVFLSERERVRECVFLCLSICIGV
jgi:hypothetical protein